MRALRISYAGELGWELHAAMADLRTLYEALSTAGAAVDLRPFGAYALNSLRLEKGYRAWGADLTTERTPLEAGLSHLVRTEGREFTGREALFARSESPSAWRMVLLSIDPDGDAGPDPFHTHTVWQNGRAVGIVTSGAPGHRTGTVLAFAYLRPEAGMDEHGGVPDARGHADASEPAAWSGKRGRATRREGRGGAPGAETDNHDRALEVSILGHRRPARVLAEPPYDPANAKLRGTPATPQAAAPGASART